LRRTDGGHTGLLIEWKYTEECPEGNVKYGHHYLPLLESADGPVDVARCGGAKKLFVDPFYQLARLHLLAQATERERVLDCDRVMVLLLVPDGNLNYRKRIPSADLRRQFSGLGVTEIWVKMLRQPDRFTFASFDGLLSTFSDEAFPALAPVLREVRARYYRGSHHAA
jgi:hypothetical protein